MKIRFSLSHILANRSRIIALFSASQGCFPRYYESMKKWIDPVKDQPAKESTLDTPGDFQEFTELMRKIVNKQEKTPTSSAVSHGPVVS